MLLQCSISEWMLELITAMFFQCCSSGSYSYTGAKFQLGQTKRASSMEIWVSGCFLFTTILKEAVVTFSIESWRFIIKRVSPRTNRAEEHCFWLASLGCVPLSICGYGTNVWSCNWWYNRMFCFVGEVLSTINPKESCIDCRMVPSTEWWVVSCNISILGGRTQSLTITLSQPFPSTVGSKLPVWCWPTDQPTELQSAGTIWTLRYTHRGVGEGFSPVKAPAG